nr:hypothetical protein [Microbacterium hydrocarbonoxydans]
MNSRDPLDLILERSAPTPLRIGDELARDLDQVAFAARSQVAAQQRPARRMPRIAAGVGLAVLLTGGAGAAVAAGGFEWLPWAQDPDAAYVFTLPSGRECEIRSVVEQTEDVGDWNAFVADVGQLVIDDAAVDRWAEEIRADDRAIIQMVAPDGEWVDPGPDGVPTEDDLYAAAHWVAFGEGVAARATEAGVIWGFTGDQAMHCEVVTP